MNVGCIVYLNQTDDLAERFEYLRDEGFTSCQICCWDPELYTSENAKIIIDSASKNKVSISSLWCGWSGPTEWNFYGAQNCLGLVPPEYREQRTRELCMGSDFAKKIGVCDIVTHMGFIPENPNDPEFIPFCNAVKIVAQYAKNNGQYLLFETGQETPVTMLRCFEVIGVDNLGVNLDTGNCILYGRANPIDALDVIGPYVRCVHAKDAFYPTNGHDLGKEVSIGTGKVDFEAILRKLKELGLSPDLIIEREIGDNEQVADIRRAKHFLETLILRVFQ